LAGPPDHRSRARKAVTLPSSFAARQPTDETSGHQGVDVHFAPRRPNRAGGV